MITLENIRNNFFNQNNKLNTKYINEINKFIDVFSYNKFLNTNYTELKHEPHLRKIILDYIESNEYEIFDINTLKIGSIVSNEQICAFSNKFDMQGGILSNSSEINNGIYARMRDCSYEYKITTDKVINVENKIMDDGQIIKYYIKTKTNFQNPIDQFEVNKEVSGMYGSKPVFFFQNVGNGYKFLGKYFCKSLESEKIDGENLFYWILTRNLKEVNEGYNYLNIIENICKSYERIFDKTEVQRIVKQRVGQTWLKDKLLSIKTACEISGIKDSKLLIASHIKPWSKSNDEEKLDVDNTLLLSPTFDKLFDKGYISFDDNGNILISKKLSNHDRDIIFNGYTINQIHLELNSKKITYMKYHRNNIYMN